MGQPLRFLLIEDSQDDAELLLRSLRRGGYELVARQVASREEVGSALEHDAWDAGFRRAGGAGIVPTTL